MRCVIAGWGSAGDVLPLVAIGAELRRRGHEVYFVGNAAFAADASDAGIAFTEVGTRADHQRLLAEDGLFGVERKEWDAFYAEHYYPLIPAFHAAVDRLVAGAGPTVVFADEVGASAAAERRGLPRVRAAPSSVRFFSRYDPPHPEIVFDGWARVLARSPRGLSMFYRAHHLRHGIVEWPARVERWPADHPVARFRASVGVPAESRPAADLMLCLWPDWFAAPQADWPPNAVTTTFPLPSVSGEWDVPPEAPDGPVIATTGSVAGSQPAFYSCIADACRALGRPAWLITPHREHVPPDLPPFIRHLSFAPFDRAFRYASLVVHHGGIGTAAQALALAVPQIVVPIRGDQFDNGNRMVRLGVASMVRIDRVRADGMAALIRDMTGSPRIRERCRHWQARLAGEEGLSRVARYVEALAAGRGLAAG